MTDPLAPLSTRAEDFCFVDVETRSFEDVTIHGAYRHNAKGRVTIFTYAIGDGEVKDWVLEDWTPGKKLDWADAPDDLLDALQEVEEGRKWFVAHNAGFEYNAFTRGMIGLEDFRVEWMIDSMIQGMRSHLPADLKGAAKAIGLTQKQDAGKALIRLFADEAGTATPQSHPEEWAAFRSYARDDVAAMRDVFFATMPLHRRMWEEYWASERINHRGVKIDLPFVRGAAALAAKLAAKSNADIEELTGGEVKTVRQNAALLNWIRRELRHLPEVDRILTREFEMVDGEDGERESVPKYSLGREIVEALTAYLERIDETQGLTDAEWNVLQVLEVRLYGASATPAKFQKILDTVDVDGRLKGQYVYGGAAATVRFSSKGVQIHNLSRDTVGSLDDEVDAIELITEKGADAYDDVKQRWGHVGKVLSRLIRPCFIAPEDQTLVFTDLSSIEAVVCPWLTDDEDAEPLLEAIRANHRDPANPDMYRVQAGSMLGKDPFEVTKAERQSHGKTVQLACIAEGQLVLTDVGLVPIEKVTLDMQVWDGVKFVSHSGLVDKGIKDVWEYQGLVATLDHIVWTEEAGQTTLQRAARSGARLLQSGAGRTPIRSCGRDFGRTSIRWDGLERALRALSMRELRARGMDSSGFAASRYIKGLRELHETKAATEMAGSSAHRSEGALHESERSGLASVWGKGDRVSIRERDRSRAVDHTESRSCRQGYGDRPYRQQRALRGGESALGDAKRAELEQADERARTVDVCAGGMALRVQHRAAQDSGRLDPRADHRAGTRSCADEAQGLATYRGKARVYDLLNCGPRNRFTVSNVLVHNCQFLGGKGSLFNMGRIYRVHFEDDEAQEIIDRWRDRNKWAMRFGNRIWEGVQWCMENPGEPREAGRITLVYDAAYLRGTLFMVLPNGDPLLYPGIAWREVTAKDKATGEEKTELRLTVRKGRGISPLWAGELVNNATQATAAALLRNALRVLDEMGSPVVVMHTHDEIVVQTPAGQADRADEVLLKVMTERPEWAPGLPIAAEPTRWDWYTKCLG